jgi:general secretion pathway protein C
MVNRLCADSIRIDMEARLQKYGWIITLVLIAVSALILAFAASEFIAIYLAPYRVPEIAIDADKTNSKKPDRLPTRTRTNFSRTIVDRCLFGCPEKAAPAACEEPCEPGQVCQDGVCVQIAPQASPDGIPVPSDMDVNLLGAMVANNPDYSVALIQDPTSKTTYVAGVGEFIGPDAEVLEIYRDRVIIRRKGRLEFIKLDDSLMGNPSATRTLGTAGIVPPAAIDLKSGTLNDKTPNLRKKDGPSSPAEAVEAARQKNNEGVNKVADGKFELDRDAINDQLQDPKALAKQARIIPNYSDGKRAGIKLVGVTPGGVFGKIGIRSGDIVHSINGEKVTSQNKAFELLDGMRKANNVQIEIERGGKRQSIEYSIK